MLNRYRLPILAGLLIGTSYIPFPPWAMFFCLVPLWIFTVREENPKRAFWGGWITQFILNAIGFHWIAYTAVEFGHFPWWAGTLVLIGFCAIAHLYFPVAAAVWVYINNRLRLSPALGVLLLSSLFALFELIFPVLFPWHLGYPWLWAKLPGAQAADLIGFQGLNVATIFINGLLTLAWLAKGEPKKRWRHVATAAGIFAILNVVGLVQKKPWDRFDAEMKVLAVQGNIGNWEKILAEKGRGYQDDIVQRYIAQSTAGLSRHPETDVLLWPETAFPNYLDTAYHGDKHSLVVREFLKTVGKPLLTGAYSRDVESRLTYNGFFLMNPEGHLPVPPYRKTILLAFGEYFPGADWFPVIMKLFPDLSAFGRGQGPTSMNWKDWKIGAQICYEGLYPWFTRGLVEKGAEILVNVTNDSWFGTHFEPKQHLYMTFARAIEFRRPLMRSTNTGITTAILANGDILEKSPLHTEWQGLFNIRYRKNPPRTVYSYLEPVWPWLLFATCLGLVGFGRLRRRSAG